jgi:autotransporter-associated beta strand protein
LDIGAAVIENGGSFALTKTGSGVLSLLAANTLSGGITVNQGSLEIGNATGAGTGAIQLASRDAHYPSKRGDHESSDAGWR